MVETTLTKQPSRNLGAVKVLAILFVLSGGLRIATGATEVLAEAKTVLEPTSTEPVATSETGNAKRLSEEHFASLLRDFELREERLKRQERALEKRMIVLQTTEARVLSQIEQMEQSEQSLRATLALASTAAEDDLARLTTVYENMKPKTAAALFEEMEPEFAAGFIARMRPDAAATVMAGMTPHSAYTISTVLAGRNSEVPTE